MKLITIKDQSMDVMQLGEVLSKSGFFQDTRQAAQAVVKVLAANELGIGPIAGMTGIYIVKGKVTLSANIIAAVIKRSKAYDYRVRKMDSDACVVEFFQNGESIGVSEFTAADAKAANLGGDNWKKYPRNMLFARAMSNGAKWYCPDVFSGSPVYTPDELGAEVDGETGEIIDAQAYEVPDEQLQQRVAEDRQDANKSATAQAYETFMSHCRIEWNIKSDDSIKAILRECGYNSFSVDQVNEYHETISDQMVNPTCDTALLLSVNDATNGYYSHVEHMKNAVAKADPNFVWPLPDETGGWNVAGQLALDYALANQAQTQPIAA